MLTIVFPGKGVVLRPTVTNAEGKAVLAPPVHCHLVCLGFHADAPARVALMNAMAVTSYLGCLYCKMTQTFVSATRRLFMGYASAVQITRGLLKGQHRQMVCNRCPVGTLNWLFNPVRAESHKGTSFQVVDDDTLRLTDTQQLNRARQAEVRTAHESEP